MDREEIAQAIYKTQHEDISTDVKPSSIEDIFKTCKPKGRKQNGEKYEDPRVIPPRYNDQDFPETYNLSGVSSEKRDLATKYLNLLRGYAQTPIVVDSFENHQQRTAWQEEALSEALDLFGSEGAEKLRRLIDDNRLSGNRITWARQAIDILQRVNAPIPIDHARNILENAAKMVEMQKNGEWNDPQNKDQRVILADTIADEAAKIVQSFA